MRVPKTLLLLCVALIAKVSSSKIFWDEEDDASNEFLEVDNYAGVMGRFKRQLIATPPPENEESVTADDEETLDNDNDFNEGSGQSDFRSETEFKEKTIHVSFVVNQPYQTKYSNRDSVEFQNFSKSLAEAVNAVFQNLPGTHRASLVRIQSRPTDEFTCKVTLEIVTMGYETDRITEILRDYIRKKRILGNVAVDDVGFSSTVIDPGNNTPLDTCVVDEIRCYDGRCVPESARCNGVNDCSDGFDELNCPGSLDNEDDQEEDQDQDEGQDQDQDQYQDPDQDQDQGQDQDQDQNLDQDRNQDLEQNQDQDQGENQNPNPSENEDGESDQNLNQDLDSTQVPNQTFDQESPVDSDRDQNGSSNRNADNLTDRPSVDNNSNADNSRGTTSDPLDFGPSEDGNENTGDQDVNSWTETPTEENEPFRCQGNDMSCDETRCFSPEMRCDGRQDCDDGTDEAGCQNDQVSRLYARCE